MTSSQLSPPIGQVPTPSLALPPTQLKQQRGTCTLSHPNVGTLQFRTNPNEITWDYELITHIQQTYGGRVIQILGVKMDNLKVLVDCGQGGWPYAMYVVQFMRDVMVNQRGTGTQRPATFTYTTRNWKLNVYALNVPFHDSVTETVREMELNFKIQEDVSGIQSAASLQDAISALQDGIGWVASVFNQGAGSTPNNASGGGAFAQMQSTPTTNLPTAMTGPPNTLGIPGLSDITNLFGGFFGGI